MSLRIPLLAATALLTLSLSAAELKEVAKPTDIRRTPRTGQILVVNVWATWCVPCVHEMDDLRKVSTAFKTKGVEFLGVSMDDVLPADRAKTKEKVSRFLTMKAIAYPNLYYTGKANALADALDFDGELPMTLVYDRQGKELFRVSGVINREEFSQRLEKLISKRKDGKS